MNSSRRALEARQLGLRHLLGGGVLLLAIVPGYLASHLRGATDGGHVATDASAPAIRSHIKEAATRYAVSEDLVIAVIEVESRFDARVQLVDQAGHAAQVEQPETVARMVREFAKG